MIDPDTQMKLIDVTLYFTDGEEVRTRLPSNSEFLRHLHEALASPNSGVSSTSKFLQIPLDSGRRACSFRSERLVAIETCPPVLIVPVGNSQGMPAGGQPHSLAPAEREPSGTYEVVESDEPVAEQEEERFRLKVLTDWDDPGRGVARWYYIGEHRAGVMCMSQDGVLLVDVNIPAELRRRRYQRRILTDSLKFFRSQGRRIEAIRGQYARSSDYPDGISTNLTVFMNAYLEQQLTLEDAALAAPAGRNARYQGFPEVVVMEMPSKGWNAANDRPAYIESLQVRYCAAEGTDPENRANQLGPEHGQNHSIARQGLHRLYLEQLDTITQAAGSNPSMDPDSETCANLPDAPQTVFLNYDLPDHLYGRFKSLARQMIGSEKAEFLSSRIVAYMDCRAGETICREPDDGCDYTMIAMLGDGTSAESISLELDGEWAGTAPLQRGDLAVFPGSLAYKLQPSTNGKCELIVIEWWSHGRNFINQRMTPQQISDPLLELANRQLGNGRKVG